MTGPSLSQTTVAKMIVNKRKKKRSRNFRDLGAVRLPRDLLHRRVVRRPCTAQREVGLGELGIVLEWEPLHDAGDDFGVDALLGSFELGLELLA